VSGGKENSALLNATELLEMIAKRDKWTQWYLLIARLTHFYMYMN